jgi:hypothetical protein
MNTTTLSAKRIVLVVIATLVFVPTTYLVAKSIESAHDYKCPTLTVTVKQGDTLSGITKAHCEGDTLQASWDIARIRGGAFVQIGDLVQLGESK